MQIHKTSCTTNLHNIQPWRGRGGPERIALQNYAKTEVTYFYV